jgi:quercetin dioxygenase-like cupin family protein
MMKKRYTKVTTSELEGFQHAHDLYWCRPVVFGKQLYTYVAYVPPGGFMPAHGHEEDPYELSFFMVRGELDVTLDGDTFPVKTGDAVHVEPTVSLGVRNKSDATAIFVLTFNPPPPRSSVEEMRQRALGRGSIIKTPAEMEELART